MNKQRTDKHPPEQKAAEQLLKVLGAANTEDGVAKAQALAGAVMVEPLIMTVSINRATGKLALVSNISAASEATDLRMLHEAMLVLSGQLSEAMVRAARGNQ